MNNKNIFQIEIEKYDMSTAYYQELSASELLQKMILAGLADTDFFTRASFHGGTALRIFFKLNRYSQDLDFSLIKKNGKFEWKPYLQQIQEKMQAYGCFFEIYDKSHRESTIAIAEIRDLSLCRMLNLEWAARSEHPKKIMVKLELNTNPPSGNTTLEKNIDFPCQKKIRIDDLPSLFAGKIHALLCRDYGEYVKGRDWYDFLWYTSKRIEPNYLFLSEALNREGKWKNQQIKVSRSWCEYAIREKIETVNIDEAKKDVIRFISPAEQNLVKAWDKNTFFNAVDTFHANCLKSDRKKSIESNREC
jgi:predicted nucleotidyltransferase component of viral defense system